MSGSGLTETSYNTCGTSYTFDALIYRQDEPLKLYPAALHDSDGEMACSS
jgi:hypothetical protein